MDQKLNVEWAKSGTVICWRYPIAKREEITTLPPEQKSLSHYPFIKNLKKKMVDKGEETKLLIPFSQGISNEYCKVTNFRTVLNFVLLYF